jgi:hypothetical protein
MSSRRSTSLTSFFDSISHRCRWRKELKMLWSEFPELSVPAPRRENTNARPQSFSYRGLQEPTFASIFPGSDAHLSPKDTTERTFRSISNG